MESTERECLLFVYFTHMQDQVVIVLIVSEYVPASEVMHSHISQKSLSINTTYLIVLSACFLRLIIKVQIAMKSVLICGKYLCRRKSSLLKGLKYFRYF